MLARTLGTAVFVLLAGCASTKEGHVEEPPAPSGYLIEVQELTTQPTAVIRATVTRQDLGNRMGELLGKVETHLRQHGLQPLGPSFARYYSVTPTEVDVEVGYTLPQPLSESGEVVAAELPGGPAAVTLHVGPYQHLPRAHQAVDQWLQANGRRPAGPAWEVYVTTAQGEPAESRTRVVRPLTVP